MNWRLFFEVVVAVALLLLFSGVSERLELPWYTGFGAGVLIAWAAREIVS